MYEFFLFSFSLHPVLVETFENQLFFYPFYPSISVCI